MHADSWTVEAQTAPATPQWCVASEQATDAQLQEALDWACSSQGGANCSSIQSDGICFLPNSLTDHASFAFNDYWQKFKASDGSCDFKGSAVLVDSDPSNDFPKHLITYFQLMTRLLLLAGHDPCIYLQLP